MLTCRLQSRKEIQEDLYYRLNTVPITIPPLRHRAEDVILLFRKFASDFADKYRMPPVRLDEDARNLLMNFQWPGNVRQLKNITEQISIIEQQRDITAQILKAYLPTAGTSNLPAIFRGANEKTFNNEREILYQVLFDMKRDMNDLKKLVLDLMSDTNEVHVDEDHAHLFRKLYPTENLEVVSEKKVASPIHIESFSKDNIMDTEEFVEESLSLEDKEIELIRKALEKHNGKRKLAAQELGISERTLYRKIKEYDIDG